MAIVIVVGPTPGSGSSVNTVVGEVPSGSSTTFTIAHAPSANTLALYRNGVRQSVTDDYTLSGANITLLSTLQSGEKLTADYEY